MIHDEEEEEGIASLLLAERQQMAEKEYLGRCGERSVEVSGRGEAVNWILKVQAFYEFRPVTAFLSVNYLDRFLSCCSLPSESESGWAFQLLSVACLSLAAKMEESHVPFLLDLQLFHPPFIFHPKTVQRMELWVMTHLKWRLRSVTPFDYLHYFISNLPSSSSTIDHFSTASNLILSTTRVHHFFAFPPSTVAAAALLCSAGYNAQQLPLSFHHRLNQEMVRCCHQLMEDTCLVSTSTINPTIAEPTSPSSPVGVLDAATCASCDTPSDRNFAASTHQQAEPPNKRPRPSTPDVPQR